MHSSNEIRHYNGPPYNTKYEQPVTIWLYGNVPTATCGNCYVFYVAHFLFSFSIFLLIMIWLIRIGTLELFSALSLLLVYML